jgi:hypothetical protein
MNFKQNLGKLKFPKERIVTYSQEDIYKTNENKKGAVNPFIIVIPGRVSMFCFSKYDEAF